jgi:hypothetical protein
LCGNLNASAIRFTRLSVSVADQTYTVDAYYTAQPNWFKEEIDVAFQMEGNDKQEPYKVRLDQVSLLAN